MPLKTSSAKAKGRSTQQYVRDLINEIFELREGDVESRGMGQAGVDIILSPAARDVYPFSYEVKHTKKFPTMQEIKQARYNTIEGTIAGVVHQPHGAKKEDTSVTFNLREFTLFWSKHRVNNG